MFKKYSYLFLMFTALAILLGHSFVGHHHHGIESLSGNHSHSHVTPHPYSHTIIHNIDYRHQTPPTHQHNHNTHSHATSEHNSNDKNKHEGDENDLDLIHILSHFPHHGTEITFLRARTSRVIPQQQSNLITYIKTVAYINDLTESEHQRIPRYAVLCLNSKHFYPTGLRAPPPAIA